MLPYIILAGTPLLLKLLLPTEKFLNKEVAKKTFLILFGFALFFMIAFRDKYVGSADSYGYYQNWLDYSRLSFDGIKLYTEESTMEKGYIYTTWFFSQFIGDAQFIFILSGALFSIATCVFIYKNSEDITLSSVLFVTLGLYVFMVQGLRQGVAMSILLFAIEFIKKRKFIPFALLVAVASLFHQSAIVFLIAYFLYGLKLKPISVLFFAAFSGLMIVFSGPLVALGNKYFERDYHGEVESGGFIALAIYVIILLTVALFSHKKQDDKNFAFFVYLTAMGMVLFLMRYFDARIIERISFYFMFGQLAVLPSVINCLEARERQLTKLAVYILSILLFIYRINGSELVPFRFYWQ